MKSRYPEYFLAKAEKRRITLHLRTSERPDCRLNCSLFSKTVYSLLLNIFKRVIFFHKVDMVQCNSNAFALETTRTESNILILFRKPVSIICSIFMLSFVSGSIFNNFCFLFIKACWLRANRMKHMHFPLTTSLSIDDFWTYKWLEHSLIQGFSNRPITTSIVIRTFFCCVFPVIEYTSCIWYLERGTNVKKTDNLNLNILFKAFVAKRKLTNFHLSS